MIAAYSAQLRLSGYARMAHAVSDGYRVCYVNGDLTGPDRIFEGRGATADLAERSAIMSYLEWARTGRTG